MKNVFIDTIKLRAYAGEDDLNLTLAELRILNYFWLNADRIISPVELKNFAFPDAFTTNAIKVHIYRLRKKLAGTDLCIGTISKRGFYLQRNELK